MTLPKKLQQTRDENAKLYPNSISARSHVVHVNAYHQGFDAGAEAVLREAEKLAIELQFRECSYTEKVLNGHLMERTHEDSCGKCEALANWAKFTGGAK